MQVSSLVPVGMTLSGITPSNSGRLKAGNYNIGKISFVAVKKKSAFLDQRIIQGGPLKSTGRPKTS